MTMRPILLPFIAAGLLTACAGTTPPNQLYLLEAPSVAATRMDNAPRLGIGNITLPDYLNRPQIVARDGGGRLLVRDRERWAEPLDEGFRRVLGENLGLALGDGRIVQLPAPPGISVDQRLHLDIIRFDASTAGEVLLHARWNLQSGSGSDHLHEQRIRITTPGQDSAATVTAMNRALHELSLHIVASLTGAAKRP